MTARAALLCALALPIAAPALAQDAADKARLEEFAVPAQARDARVPEPSETSPLPEETEARERTVAVPAVPAGHPAPVAQLSSVRERDAAPQLTSTEESRELAARSVSSPRDSRPRGATAIGGRDRCAPGTEAERSPACQDIIEHRADEFRAPEPPRLSPEQILLAERQNEDALAANPARMRARVAGNPTSPDADLAGNQELAEAYLRQSPPETPANEATTPIPEDAKAALAQVLAGIQVETGAVVKP